MRPNSAIEIEREQFFDKLFEIKYGYRPCITGTLTIKNTEIQAPSRVIFNGPATIAIWPDGTKTIVKCQDNEPFDPEKGIALAMLKKYFGGHGRYYDVIKKLTDSATRPKNDAAH